MINIARRLQYTFSTTYQELASSSRASRINDCANLKELLRTLYSTQPTMHCIIFNATWNPLNNSANQMYNNVANQNPAYSFYRINIEQNDRAAQYFGIRHTPTLLFYGLGSPLGKHIGLGQAVLQRKLIAAQEHLKTVRFLDGTTQWEGPQDFWRLDYDEEYAPFDYYVR